MHGSRVPFALVVLGICNCFLIVLVIILIIILFVLSYVFLLILS